MIAVAEPVEVGISEFSARAGSAQILVWGVDDDLGVGDVMDRGHHAPFDTDLFVQHLDHGGQTVRGA